MVIEEYDREDERNKLIASDGRSPSGKKRKRDDDIRRNMPDGACSGFVSVREDI